MKFNWNKKYNTVAAYVIIGVFGAVIAALLAWECFFFFKNRTYSGVFKIFRPFVYGFVIAYLLNPLLGFGEKYVFRFVERKKPRARLKRTLSVILAFILGVAIVAAMVLIVIPQILSSLELLGRKFSEIYNNLSTYTSSINKWLNELFDQYEVSADLEQAIIAKVGDLVGVITSTVSNSIRPIFDSVVSMVQGLINEISNIVMGVVLAVYFLLDKEKFATNLKMIMAALLPVKFVYSTVELMRTTHKTVGSFITGKILDSLIVWVIAFVVMALLKIPYAVLISAIVGITNIIPFWGAFIGGLIGFLILIIISPVQALIFLVFVIILQQIDGNILGPRIIANTIGLSSFWVIFSIIIMNSLFGFIGMFLGVPIFAVIYTLLKQFVEKRLKKKSLPVEAEYYRV